MKFSRAILAIVCSVLASCTFFSHNPALPKNAASEQKNDRASERMQSVLSADIVYFPVEMIAADDSATNIVQTLKNNGTAFSVAWEGIELEGSDQAARNEPRWSYSGKLREQCKAMMRDTIELRQLYLGLPNSMRIKLQEGGRLTREEKNMMPRGYRIPAGSLEDFAEQLATLHGLGEQDVENLYRAHVVAAQFAAEKIVLFMREHAGEKLLVFARRRELSGVCGIPAFVSQKLHARQITFDLEGTRPPQPRLVSAAGRNGTGRRL